MKKFQFRCTQLFFNYTKDKDAAKLIRRLRMVQGVIRLYQDSEADLKFRFGSDDIPAKTIAEIEIDLEVRPKLRLESFERVVGIAPKHDLELLM